MLRNIIEKVSIEFITEANSSPNLLEDMAAMEKYMSESYSGRIFAELLQNADDCDSKKILLLKHEEHVVFANDGRCFNQDDVVSICRSGASFKKRGSTIGYRGIGFKSTAYMTKEIIIYSDNTYFTFSKAICSKVLGKSEDKIPTVRIPFLVENPEQNFMSLIDSLSRQGYNTVFIFKNANTELFLEELNDISNGYFIFLRNICQCEIFVNSFKKIYSIDRQSNNYRSYVNIKGDINEDWLVVRSDVASIALKQKEGRLVACDDSEAVYHCYLPTYDKMAFPIKANADFSTDPSRKHITNDEITEKALHSIADLLFQIMNDTLNSDYNDDYSYFPVILTQPGSFSRANTQLKERLKTRVLSEKWLSLNDGTYISADEYAMLPDWLEDSEKNLIRQKSKLVNDLSVNMNTYKKIIGVDTFLSQYTTRTFTVDDFISILEDVDFASSINSGTSGKILAHIIKAGKSAQYIRGQSYKYSDIVINTDSGIKSLGEVSKSKNIEMTKEVKEVISQIASSDDIAWFAEKESIPENALRIEPIETPIEEAIIVEPFQYAVRKPIRPAVSKWRSAEQQCVEFEKHIGNNAIDVSRQNVGYDVDSTTPSGKKRYIEVKLLPSTGGAFTMTNNEYTAAHQYGEDYYVCLVTQSDNAVRMLYICDPLKSLSFEKRIRQWEWYCEKYNGTEYTIDVE